MTRTVRRWSSHEELFDWDVGEEKFREIVRTKASKENKTQNRHQDSLPLLYLHFTFMRLSVCLRERVLLYCWTRSCTPVQVRMSFLWQDHAFKLLYLAFRVWSACLLKAEMGSSHANISDKGADISQSISSAKAGPGRIFHGDNRIDCWCVWMPLTACSAHWVENVSDIILPECLPPARARLHLITGARLVFHPQNNCKLK